MLHAYGDAEGPLEVEVCALPGTVEVTVRDHGSGIPATVGAPSEKVGIGLSVIQTLAERSDFRVAKDNGTEVWMAFEAPAGASASRPSQTTCSSPPRSAPSLPEPSR